MDIEQIKKLNEMTKTLQQHGLANTSEEGSQIAGGITETKMPTDNCSSEITKDYIELMMERTARKLMHEIEDLRNKVGSLTEQIEIIKNQKITQRVVIKEVSSEPQSELKVEEKVEAPSQPAKNSRQITRDDVKNGSDPDEIDPETVSVEKMFYYGNK